MVAAFQSKLARRADGKLRCMLGELTSQGLQPPSQDVPAAGGGAAAATPAAAVASPASAAGEAAAAAGLQLGRFDLALSHMTFHHLTDVHGESSRCMGCSRAAQTPGCLPWHRGLAAGAAERLSSQRFVKAWQQVLADHIAAQAATAPALTPLHPLLAPCRGAAHAAAVPEAGRYRGRLRPAQGAGLRQVRALPQLLQQLLLQAPKPSRVHVGAGACRQTQGP